MCDLAEHGKKRRRSLTLFGGGASGRLTRSVEDHGCLKASRAADRERTTALAAGTVNWDSHRAGGWGGLPVEPQQDEGEERDRGAENT